MYGYYRPSYRSYGSYKYIAKLKKKLSNAQKRNRAATKMRKLMQDNEVLKQGSAASQALYGTALGPHNVLQSNARKAMAWKGEGDYKSILKYASRGLGGLVGAAQGYMQGGFGGLSGGALSGWNQGADFSKWAGWGDYTSNQIAGGTSSQISVNQQDMSGDIYVTRTEFVQNVVCSNTGAGASPFQITSFALNPGLSQTFPWLSQIAQNFTLYEFHGLMFQYKPTFTENAGSANNLGKVIMATNYDPDASPFYTSVQMENYDYANACKPSDGLIHGVETKNSQQFGNMQYLRTGASSRDKIFTDIGNFYVATEGIPFSAAGQQIIGELWVTYSVKLSRAELYNSLLGQAINTDILQGTSSAAQLTTGTTLTKSTNSIGVVVFPINSTSFSIQFPINISLGFYQVVVVFRSGGTVFTTQAPTPVSAPVNLQFYLPGRYLASTASAAEVAPNAPVATTSNSELIMMQYVAINAPGLSQASFTVNVSAALTATTTWYVYVTQANANCSYALT